MMASLIAQYRQIIEKIFQDYAEFGLFNFEVHNV